MADRTNQHLEFQSYRNHDCFVSPNKGGGKKILISRPDNYYIQKCQEIQAIEEQLQDSGKPFTAVLKISGRSDKNENFESLDTKKGDIKLLSLHKVSDIDENTIHFTANVRLKDKTAFEYFKNHKLHNSSKGKQTNLCTLIDQIQLANGFNDLLVDGKPEQYDPKKDYWFEIWLSNDDNKDNRTIFSDFIQQLKKVFPQVQYHPKPIELGDYLVALIKTNEEVLDEISLLPEYTISEIRFAKMSKSFLDYEIEEQQHICDNLLERIDINDSINTFSVLLDTGVNRGHPFLEKLLPEERNLTLDPEWGTEDQAYVGGKESHHGTAMAGLCLYGDFDDLVTNDSLIKLSHGLASIKIYPRRKTTEKPPIGVVQDAIQKIQDEFDHQNMHYNCVLASTVEDTYNGIISTYAAMLDTKIFQNKQLFLISAGNCPSKMDLASEHLKIQQESYIETPAESWNALSIGAYTNKNHNDPSDISWIPMNEAGDLSPYSRYAQPHENSPIKPEILFEGGNLCVTDDGKVSQDDHLDLLTTNYNFAKENKWLSKFNATSAATALAGRFASIVMATYPDFWPETIRGLMVHSADWTQTMLKQCNLQKAKVTDKVYFLQKYGYGVPNLDRALKSANNSTTMIAQTEFQLFEQRRSNTNKTENYSNCVVFTLPIPKIALENIIDKEVKLKITLSYFIKPRAGYRGNKEKFQYQSHGLRFDIKNPSETAEDFLKRVNKAERAELYSTQKNGNEVHWVLGKKVRDKVAGSILKDIWQGSAAKLKEMDSLIIYPISGWWKYADTPPGETKIRFSLIIDIETLDESLDIDLYSEIKSVIENQQTIENQEIIEIS